MRSHRFGSRTTRRMAERPRASRKRASALFAATMKLSMMSRARFWGVIWMSTTRPWATTGRGSRVSKSSSPSRLRSAIRRRAASSCSWICSSSSGRPAVSGGAGPWPSSQSPTPSYSSLAWLVTTARETDSRCTSPVGPTSRSTTMARRSSPGFSEVRSLLRRSGSMGKTATPA